jgi:hypothetical protein
MALHRIGPFHGIQKAGPVFVDQFISLGEPAPRLLCRSWKRPDDFSQKYPLSAFSPGESQTIKVAPWMPRNIVCMISGAAIVSTTFVGILLAQGLYIYR